MALSSAERSKRRRDKIRQKELKSVRVFLPYAVHARLKRKAAHKGMALEHHVIAILTRSAKG